MKKRLNEILFSYRSENFIKMLPHGPCFHFINLLCYRTLSIKPVKVPKKFFSYKVLLLHAV